MASKSNKKLNTHDSRVQQANHVLLKEKAQMEKKMMAMQQQIDNIQNRRSHFQLINKN
jgi:hypothetical protein